jgi:hypothetical protein
MKTEYEYENWMNPGLACDQLEGVMSYEPLLAIAAAPATVVLYCEEDGYEGEWVALLCKDGRIGVVDGYFGSCSGCDALEGEDGVGEVHELAEMYLSSVRSFACWEELTRYLRGLVREDAWTLRGIRAELLKFCELGLDLAAGELFCVLRDENPEMELGEVVELAGLLADGVSNSYPSS